MLDKIKLGLLLWGTIALLILFFVTMGFWVACSMWWLLTNNMVDRNTFFLMSIGTTFIISLCCLGLGMITEKK
tara:strand:+ start:559 stop:777 length:219 start_codon:yes stop_codon:yes gene_type:complete